GLRCRGAVGAGAAALLLGSAGALHGLLRLHFVGRPATAVRNVSAPNADGAPRTGTGGTPGRTLVVACVGGGPGGGERGRLRRRAPRGLCRPFAGGAASSGLCSGQRVVRRERGGARAADPGPGLAAEVCGCGRTSVREQSGSVLSSHGHRAGGTQVGAEAGTRATGTAEEADDAGGRHSSGVCGGSCTWAGRVRGAGTSGRLGGVCEAGQGARGRY